ncbi:MAG: Crp/Fnr family transcriptional regulator [Thioalkalivibrionaceae bacterium]
MSHLNTGQTASGEVSADGRAARPVHCQQCLLAPFCLPPGLSLAELARIDSEVRRRARMRRGDSLYRAGQAFGGLFALRSGALRLDARWPDGRYSVVDVVLPGELVGLDGVGRDTYSFDAVALGDVSVCALPVATLERLQREIPSLQRHFLAVMGARLRDEYERRLRSSMESADARLAMFFIEYSARLERTGRHARRFRLALPLRDLADLLGLRAETLSRVLNDWERGGVIARRGPRDIELLDLDVLHQRAGVGPLVKDTVSS